MDLDPIADFFAEEPIERIGVLSFGISSWLVAVANDAPTSMIQTIIQIMPPLLGIYVAHRSMERAHELRMEKARRQPLITPPKPPTKDTDDTVDIK
jgi:hypothetical protein